MVSPLLETFLYHTGACLFHGGSWPCSASQVQTLHCFPSKIEGMIPRLCPSWRFSNFGNHRSFLPTFPYAPTVKTLIKVILFNNNITIPDVAFKYIYSGKKLFYLVGVALLGGRIVIRGPVISVTKKSHLPYCRIDKLKMATAMLGHFFGLPTGLFCIGCFTAELGAGEADLVLV